MEDNIGNNLGMDWANGMYGGYDSPWSWVVTIIVLVSSWVIFTKAGRPGWAAIVPIYNVWVLLEIVKKPWWWILLLLIPIVNIVVAVLITHELSMRFGKGGWFTVGLLLLPFVFYPILAFGDSKYKG